MRNIFSATLIILLFLGLLSCEDTSYDECVVQPNVNANEVDLNIVQLQNVLPEISKREEMVAFLNENPVTGEIFLKRNQYPSDSLMITELLNRFSNPHIDSLQGDVTRIFGDLSDLSSSLRLAYANYQYYYPDITLPTVKTVTTGIAHDLYVSDSLVIIGLDYFLGDDSKYRPIGLFQYMLPRYSPEKIVPSVMLIYGISPRINKLDPSNKTMLADMVTYGKAYYFAKHMLPCTPDSVLISYTSEEMAGLRTNAGTVWTHFLQNDLLFETNHMVKKKYLDERPKTYEIGDKAPGRIATYVGWDIVRSYMKRNPDVTLQELMNESDPQKILDGSNYAPKNK